MDLIRTKRSTWILVLKVLLAGVAMLSVALLFAPLPNHHSSLDVNVHQERRQHVKNNAAQVLATLFETTVSKTAMQVSAVAGVHHCQTQHVLNTCDAYVQEARAAPLFAAARVVTDRRCEGIRHRLGSVDLGECATRSANAGKDFFSYTAFSQECEAHDVTDEDCSGAAMEESSGTDFYKVVNSDLFFRIPHEVAAPLTVPMHHNL